MTPRELAQSRLTAYAVIRVADAGKPPTLLSLALTSLWVRDDAWTRMDPGHDRAHERLWADLTRHAQPGYVAAPACDGCGTQVPYTDSYYVDGAGQLCTTTCTAPAPEWAADMEPPF